MENQVILPDLFLENLQKKNWLKAHIKSGERISHEKTNKNHFHLILLSIMWSIQR